MKNRVNKNATNSQMNKYGASKFMKSVVDG